MGNGNTKEGIILRLDELDVEELRLNIKLKELQKKLNEMVPNEEKVELNQDLQNETIEIIKLKNQNPLEYESEEYYINELSQKQVLDFMRANFVNKHIKDDDRYLLESFERFISFSLWIRLMCGIYEEKLEELGSFNSQKRNTLLKYSLTV